MAEGAAPRGAKLLGHRRSGSTVARAFLLALAAALVLRIVFFALSVTHLPPTGDESSNVLLGKSIARGERPLLFSGQPYQFPLEAYALAPISGWMPRNALGARSLFFLVSLVTAGLMVAALVRVSPLCSSWPGILLVLFPSAYWLTLQAAYYIPQYTAFLFFTALLLWLAARTESATGVGRAGLCAIAGLAAGMAWSTHTLILPVAFMTGCALCLGGNRRELAAGTAAFLPGLAVGFIPYLLALRHHPGAFKAVSATNDVRKAFSSLWDPMLTSTLPSSMGITPPLFPDFIPRIDTLSALAKPFALVYIALLLVTSVRCATGFVRRLCRQRHPTLTLADICTSISWLSLLMFLFSARSRVAAYRYLLPAVVTFPFLVAFLHGSSRTLVRRLAAGLALILVPLNILATGLLMRSWMQPGFAAGVPDTPPLAPLIARLKESGVSRCYASFWQSYRITHDTDEKIVASAPYNERFYRWPLPYQEEVATSAAPPPYVFTDTHQSRIKASRFEGELRRSEIDFVVDGVGPFRIFRNFGRADGLAERTGSLSAGGGGQSQHRASTAPARRRPGHNLVQRDAPARGHVGGSHAGPTDPADLRCRPSRARTAEEHPAAPRQRGPPRHAGEGVPRPPRLAAPGGRSPALRGGSVFSEISSDRG